MTTPLTAVPPSEYVALLNVSVRAADADEAREVLEATEWIADLSGRQPHVVPIFHALRGATITQVRVLGVIPTVLQDKDDRALGDTILFSGSCLVYGRAKNKHNFDTYMRSDFWRVKSRVKVHNIASAYSKAEIDVRRLM